ncbi:NUDIX domain-containing protein [Microlunatus elymi]|uniref:NUDIX domain-containing protein n=1 Tax=Microlunatus elymi TaxID=2596828 RepID=A0A516Q2P3_9ACTN|nr:NUDIX domain-containing protein [Microlunatus elymi]QDP97678.1 NUDIX domain-containing protein [Microlunatus elymi]
MPTPEFVLQLRRKIGNDLLLFPGVKSVVFDRREDPSRVLLGKRSDNGQWHLPAGMMEPGEQPAPALVREVLEETGVVIEIDRLISVLTLPRSAYPNGDQVQFLSCAFRAHYVSGDARVADDESLEVGWYDLDRARRMLGPADRESIELALPLEGPPFFHR